MFKWITTFYVIVATLLLLRNVALESPLMAGDEYAYFAAAQTFPHSAERFISDPHLPRIYSPVFAAYGHALFAAASRPEYLMKALNVLAFAGAVAVFLSLLPVVGGRSPSRLLAALLLLTPISAYTAYFMPESTYGLFFAALAWAMVKVLPVRPLAGAAMAGATVGAMLLIKPHALALFVAVPLTLAAWTAAPARLRPRLTTVAAGAGVFAAACYVTLVIVNLLLSPRLELHPLTFVGAVYRPYLSGGSSPAAWLERQRALAAILAGHLIVLGALLSPAAAVAAGQLRRLHRLPAEAAGTAERHLYVLVCFAAAVAITTVGMTTVFTMVAAQSSAIEHLRLHGRYYSFFLPLFFLIYFAVLWTREPDGVAGGNDWLRWGAAAGAAMASKSPAAAAAARARRTTGPIRTLLELLTVQRP